MKIEKATPVKTSACTHLCECKNSIYWNREYYTKPMAQYIYYARGLEYQIYRCAKTDELLACKNPSNPRFQKALQISSDTYIIMHGDSYEVDGKYIEHSSNAYEGEDCYRSVLNIYDPKTGKIERLKHRCDKFKAYICVAVALCGGTASDIQLLHEYYKLCTYHSYIVKLLDSLVGRTGLNPKYKEIIAQVWTHREEIEKDVALPRLIRHWQQVLAYAAANDVVPTPLANVPEGLVKIEVHKNCVDLYRYNEIKVIRYHIGDKGSFLDPVLKVNPSEEDLKKMAYIVKMRNVKVEIKEKLI